MVSKTIGKHGLSAPKRATTRLPSPVERGLGDREPPTADAGRSSRPHGSGPPARADGRRWAPDAQRPRESKPDLTHALAADTGFAEADVEVQPLARPPNPAHQPRERRDSGDELVLDEPFAHGADALRRVALYNHALEPIRVQVAPRQLKPVIEVERDSRPTLGHDEVARGAKTPLAIDVGEQRTEFHRHAGSPPDLLERSGKKNRFGKNVRVEQPILGDAGNAFEADEVLEIDHQLPARRVPQVEHSGRSDEVVPFTLRVPMDGAELEFKGA